jgi:hypothetical protein
MKSRWLIVAAVAAFWLGGPHITTAAGALPGAPKTSPQRVLHRRPSRSVPRRKTAIIGSRRTHVYLSPGSTANLPPRQDRVYFYSEAQARAAGFRLGRPRGIVYPSLPRMKSESRSPASPLAREQPDTAPTQPTANP